MLIEQGALRQSGRGWSLDKQLELAMPESVHAVIANRLDLLDAEPTGRCCRPPRWSGCSSGPARWPPRWAGRSSRSNGRCAGWSSATSSTSSPPRPWPGRPEYRFRHVLVRDVCYQRLPRAERVARHERAADWLDALSHEPAAPTWPRCWPTTAGRPTRSPARSACRSAGTPGRPGRRCTGRPAGRTRCTRWTRRRATPVGRSAWPTTSDPAGRLQLELLARRSGVLPRRQRVPRPAAARSRLHRLADRLLAHGDRRRRGPGVDAARPGGLAARRPAATRWLPGPRGPAVRRAAGQPAEGRRATPSWAGCTCSTTSATRPWRRPDTAAEIAERLGLTETRANARITAGHGPLPGRRPGRPGRAARGRRVHAGSAAARAAAGPRRTWPGRCREEGDWLRSDALLDGRAGPYGQRSDADHQLLGGGDAGLVRG